MIERYTPSDSDSWDAAVRESRNGTFLHLRGYMDYHSGRFEDFSLIARDPGRRILAVLPANAEGAVLCSHRGLTYGGWLMSRRADINAMGEIWRQFRSFATKEGFDTLIYKPVPHIFHRYPAEEDLYWLWREGAAAEAVQCSSTVDLGRPIPFDSNARRALKRAAAAGIECGESTDMATFWDILSTVLYERHNTRPVHTLAEIGLLQSRFPDNIRLYGAYLGGRMVAGTVLYVTDTTAHAQYIASSDEGRACGALAALFGHIMERASAKVRWFDFGTSNEDQGRYLNEGLARQKSGFGGRCVTFTTYSLKL